MEPNNDGFDREVEDILKNVLNPKKKKVNSGAKGHRGEHGVCKILSERFGGKSFERAMGSGNRWSQVKHLPQHAKDTLLGDICAPEGFLWVLEVKNGYEDKVDFYSLFKDGSKQIDEFIEQATDESKRSGKPSLLFYKRSRRPWLAFVRNDLLRGEYEFSLKYRDWTVVALAELLKQPDDYFFKEVS